MGSISLSKKSYVGLFLLILCTLMYGVYQFPNFSPKHERSIIWL